MVYSSNHIQQQPTVSTTTQQELQLTTFQLQQHPELVAVHGVLYNLEQFAPYHPGGNHIQGAGAYDASALYASMHPGQKPTNSKLLQKYRVGVHLRGKEDVTYQYDSPFAKELLHVIRTSMKNKSKLAPVGFYLRIILIATATLYCEWQFMFTGAMLWAILIGVCHAQIGLSIQHDASHGALSKSFRINDFFAYGADWIGSSKWVWFQQHILSHHPHTNHPELDPDVTSAAPLIKLQTAENDASTNFWFTPYQHFVLHAILSLYGPSTVYNPLHILRMKHNDHISATIGQTKYMTEQKVIACVLRLFYFARIVIAPWYIGQASLFVGLIVPNLVTGILLTFLFILSHNFIGADRDPTNTKEQKKQQQEVVVASKKEEEGQAPICWYKAQAETSSTYGGTIGMLFTGGLNLQIEHHLFPRLSSWYYPMLQDDIRACCERHQVKYAYFPTLWHNIWSMFKYVRKVGIEAAMKEHAH